MRTGWEKNEAKIVISVKLERKMLASVIGQ